MPEFFESDVNNNLSTEKFFDFLSLHHGLVMTLRDEGRGKLRGKLRAQ